MDFCLTKRTLVYYFFWVSLDYSVSIIIIMMSCRLQGYPWPSLATSPYYSSSLAGLQGYILCPHIAAVCKFELVVLLLLGHMWGSIGVHHLWARPCFSSSFLRVWFVSNHFLYNEYLFNDYWLACYFCFTLDGNFLIFSL